MKAPLLPNPPTGSDSEQRTVVAQAVAQALHDLSNPVAVVSGNVQFLNAVSDTISDPDAQAAVADLQAGMVRMEEELARISVLRDTLREWAGG